MRVVLNVALNACSNYRKELSPYTALSYGCTPAVKTTNYRADAAANLSWLRWRMLRR